MLALQKIMSPLLVVLSLTGCSHLATKPKPSDTKNPLIMASVASSDNQTKKPISISVMSQKPGYLLCFYEDESNNLMRIFPNRFNNDHWLDKNQVLTLPGSMPFDLTTSSGSQEAVTCFLSDENLLSELPEAIHQNDFHNLSFDMATIKLMISDISANQYLSNTTRI